MVAVRQKVMWLASMWNREKGDLFLKRLAQEQSRIDYFQWHIIYSDHEIIHSRSLCKYQIPPVASTNVISGSQTRSETLASFKRSEGQQWWDSILDGEIGSFPIMILVKWCNFLQLHQILVDLDFLSFENRKSNIEESTTINLVRYWRPCSVGNYHSWSG